MSCGDDSQQINLFLPLLTPKVPPKGPQGFINHHRNFLVKDNLKVKKFIVQIFVSPAIQVRKQQQKKNKIIHARVIPSLKRFYSP